MEDPTEVMGPGSASATEPMSQTDPTAAAQCGDGRVDPEEKCDDGNDDPLDGCLADCRPGPTGFALGAPLVTAFRGNDVDGARSADECPPGQVLIGFEGWVGNGAGAVRGLWGICGTLQLRYGAGAFGVSVMPGEELPLRGEEAGDHAEAYCPPGQVVAGFEGTNGDIVISGLRFHCASVEIIDDGQEFSVALGELSRSDAIGESGFGEIFPDTSCGQGSVAAVTDMQSSDRIHGFGLECAPLALQLGPA